MSEALPSRFLDLKKEIASTYPDFAESSTEAWNGILEQLKKLHANVTKEGSDVKCFIHRDYSNLTGDNRSTFLRSTLRT
jgi:hypothetical protein